jgi:nucleotide-binding universal stress UspA family protein
MVASSVRRAAPPRGWRTTEDTQERQVGVGAPRARNAVNALAAAGRAPGHAVESSRRRALVDGYRKLLVPLDFSHLSDPTLDAAERVLSEGGVIHALHVVEWLPVVTGGAIGVYPHRKDIDQIRELSRDKLDGYVAERPRVSLVPIVREGRPAAVILDVAEEISPDLIVIGSHGRSGLDHLLLGSVAERVLRKARCPVLVVKTNA